MLDNRESSPHHILQQEVETISQRLMQGYAEYCTILRQAIRAGLSGKNDKLFVYQQQEQEALQTINSLEHTLAALASQSGEIPPQSEHIKTLRMQAVELTGQLLNVAREIEAKLKSDLDAVRLTLQQLAGGKAPLEAEPLYIDLKT